MALQFYGVCDSFVEMVLEEMPLLCVGWESNFALHWFLESNFLAEEQFQYEEKIQLPSCPNVITLPHEEEELSPSIAARPPEPSQCVIWNTKSFILKYVSVHFMISLCATKTTSNYFCIGSKPVVCCSIGDSRSTTMACAFGSTTYPCQLCGEHQTWMKLFISENPATHGFRDMGPQTPSTAA